MDNHQLHWYIEEILIHAIAAHGEYSRLCELIADPETVQTRFVWLHLISFLSHAAMISKYLDPIRPKEVAAERMNRLRAELDVNEKSNLLARSARDNVEHFDERIDSWVERGAGAILEMVVPNRAGFEFIGRPENSIKRLLIAEERVFVSEQRDGSRLEFPLDPIANELVAIGQNANRWIETKSPYHFIYPGV